MHKLSLDILFQMEGVEVEEIDIISVDGQAFIISIVEKAKEIKEKGVVVPEDIPLYRIYTKYKDDPDKGKLGISFNGFSQMLSEKKGVYIVESNEGNLSKNWECIDKAHLVEIERKDLKPGDIAFRTGDGKPNFNERHRYCVILGPNTYACVKNDMSIEHENFKWDYWYKVVPAE